MVAVAISSGHGKYIRGAAGSPRPPQLDEVDEARRVVDRVAELAKGAGCSVKVFHDNTSTSQSQNLNAITSWHNAQSRDYDVSVHFNAYKNTQSPMGVEVLYVTQQALAGEVSKAIAQAGGFINRGAKYRSDLAFLNNTSKPAILIETCFCDSTADSNLYRANFEEVCRRIAETIFKVSIGTEPPVEPPEPEQPPPDTQTARVDITIKTSGGPCIVSINGQDFMVNAPGPEEPATPVFPANQMNITCTVFGGSSDPNDSAYPPYDRITDSERSVALPARFSGDERPMVRVFNTANELSVLCEIRDIGPWYTDDAYWITGTRPRAEPEGATIIGGPNDGAKSNGAGIDLTPAAASAIGLEGKGVVHWTFEEQKPVA